MTTPWTWQYTLQQVVVLGLWIFFGWVAYRNVKEELEVPRND
jgi:hypothetical protein